MRAALIVAGGLSTRFGEADKAVAPLAGTPMIRRVANRATEVVDHLVVNCRGDQRPAIAAALTALEAPVEYRIDDEPDEGPMVGIANGLGDLRAEYTFVVGCDMPFIDPSVVQALFSLAEGRDGALPRFEGYPQPLHAVYRTAAMRAACEDARANDERRIAAALDRVDHFTVEWDDLADIGSPLTFRNLNTRAEFEEAAAEFATEDQHG